MNDSAVNRDVDEPTLGDGDDPPENDIELDFEPEEKSDYPWTKDPAEMLRSFIFQTLVDADIAHESQLSAADAWFAWIKDRTLPKPEKKGKHLKPVEG